MSEAEDPIKRHNILLLSGVAQTLGIAAALNTTTDFLALALFAEGRARAWTTERDRRAARRLQQR
jgi:hypothetical protein